MRRQGRCRGAGGASSDGGRGAPLRGAGDRERAAAWLERAEAELAAMGTVRLRDEAARELRRLGQRVGARRRRSAGGPGLAGLSGRERVRELVARGRTNREIASKLFLSEKTIESHLRKVFAKLGVSGRVAVAEAVDPRTRRRRAESGEVGGSLIFAAAGERQSAPNAEHPAHPATRSRAARADPDRARADQPPRAR